MDCSLSWPVPLKNIEANTIAEEMVGIFGWVGIPKEVLSDSGTQFTSAIMDETFRLLSVKGLRTTACHSMCNRIYERFKGAHKMMLQRLVVEHRKEWPRSVALFSVTYREREAL